MTNDEIAEQLLALISKDLEEQQSDKLSCSLYLFQTACTTTNIKSLLDERAALKRQVQDAEEAENLTKDVFWDAYTNFLDTGKFEPTRITPKQLEIMGANHREQNARLKEALEPFADMIGYFTEESTIATMCLVRREDVDIAKAALRAAKAIRKA